MNEARSSIALMAEAAAVSSDQMRALEAAGRVSLTPTVPSGAYVNWTLRERDAYHSRKEQEARTYRPDYGASPTALPTHAPSHVRGLIVGRYVLCWPCWTYDRCARIEAVLV